MTNNSSTSDINKSRLPEEEVSMIGYNFDELGKIFSWKDRIFRAIYPEKQKETFELLNSGLIDELVREGLFPETKIAPYTLADFDLILEHEKISPILYPDSWSFDMLKSAALCMLKVNEIARKYGYQTLDGHGFNILFKSGAAIFVDLGSFIKNVENPKGWWAYEQFIRYFYYPLKVFKSGNLFLGRAILSQGKKIMPHSSYYRFRYPLLRLFRPHTINNILEGYHKYKAFSQFSLAEINKRAPAKLRPLLSFLKKNKITFLQTVNLAGLERKIKRMKLPTYQSQWGDYHDQFIEREGRLVSTTSRFIRIIEIINELNPVSVLEIGGNQGVFSELILQDTQVTQVYCSDYDEIAVNKMYNRIRDKHLNITPVLFDIASPLVLDYGQTVEQRYGCEMVIALALTHHLILTQKIPLDKIFLQFGRFTNKYLVTEFMPLGLFSESAKRNETPPEWYTEEWFKTEFEKYFTLLYKEQLEQNRILFVGEIKNI